MDNDDRFDPLLVEVFGTGADIDIQDQPILKLSDLDEIIAAATDKKEKNPYVTDRIIKRVMYEDLCKDFVGIEVPGVEPAELPSEVGAIPSTRPKTKPNAQRRKKIKQLVTDCGIEVNQYTREAIESLISAMESYVDNQVRA